MEKVIYLLIFIGLISCGSPTDSDKNIVKEKVVGEGESARPVTVNATWGYSVSATYTEGSDNKLPSGFPTAIEEKLISKNTTKGEGWYVSSINGNDVNVEVGEDFIYYENDEYEKLLSAVVTQQTDIYLKVDADANWSYGGIDYTYLGESDIVINGKTYTVKGCEFENIGVSQAGDAYSKKIFFNKEIGIISIEYNFFSRFPLPESTTFNIKLDLNSFSE